jgi:mannose-6-phosphate isomerase-like protein (cupin superfamily)
MINNKIENGVVILGVNEGLSKIPHHSHIEGIERILLLSAKLLPSAPLHIAGHLVGKDLGREDKHDWRYTEKHSHQFDEINIIWSETGKLTYHIEIGEKDYYVSSPSAVLISAGTPHRAEAIEGQGSFFCILLKPKSEAP